MFVRQILLLIVLASSSLEAGQLRADGDAGAKAEPSGEQHWLSLFIRAGEAVERRDAPRFSSALRALQVHRTLDSTVLVPEQKFFTAK